MKYEYPNIQIIDIVEQDIVTISATVGDGGVFDPNNPESYSFVD